MTLAAPTHDTPAERSAQKRILVVDDSAAQRKLLKVYLSRWGYQVTEADSGEAAIDLYRKIDFEAVLSDWMMPGMSGLDLCREIRSTKERPYVYFILLTSKSEKVEVAQGLDVGADDFLSKPVSSDELLARLRAGERILHMERQLREKNREVGESLQKIASLYDALDNDLAEARSLQQSLVQDRTRIYGAVTVSMLLKASGHVGGDLVGCFPVDEKRIGVFSIDVSGHGVASAMLTARIAGLLSSADPEQNVALVRGEHGKVSMLPPSEAARRLNRLYFRDIRAEQYFTMVLAEIDTVRRKVSLVMCGHPRPLIQDRDGKVYFVEGSGLPLGLFEDADWTDIDLQIPKGGRLFLTSDGITECASPDGTLLDEGGLSALMSKNKELRGQNLFEALIWDLNAHANDHDFTDDVSGVLVEFPRRSAKSE